MMKKKKSKSVAVNSTNTDKPKVFVRSTGKSASSTPASTAIFQKLPVFLKTIGPLCIAFFLCTAIFHNTHDLAFNVRNSGAKLNLRALMLLLSIVLVLISFIAIFRISISNRLKNVFLLLYSTLTFFLVFEIIFMYLPVSQGSGEAYCMRIWFSKYWNLNEHGYRDASYDAKSDTLKDIVVMLGDSYVAGHGTKYPDERMSDILGKKTGAGYRVFNLGENGAHTQKEYGNLLRFPYKFDKLILVHVPNDLEYIETNPDTNTTSDSNASPDKPGIFSKAATFLVNESFFINFLSFTGFGNAVKAIPFLLKNWNKLDNLENARKYPFSDSLQLKQHIKNLVWLDSTESSQNVQMLILSFPLPGNNDPVMDRHYNNFIEQLKIHNLNFLDVLPICKQLPVRKQIVSKLDKHPSVLLQKMVTDSLYSRLKKEHWFN
ncbi:MAG: SGNH/GDSL hydrolase family protein [Sphingobacteriales bacterium]|nr:SGNH/GDSL hydrolase family protein [Sphingobacteriales bacterium]